MLVVVPERPDEDFGGEVFGVVGGGAGCIRAFQDELQATRFGGAEEEVIRGQAAVHVSEVPSHACGMLHIDPCGNAAVDNLYGDLIMADGLGAHLGRPEQTVLEGERMEELFVGVSPIVGAQAEVQPRIVRRTATRHDLP